MTKRNICTRCGWHYFKHRDGKCKGMRRKPDGSYHRFTKKANPDGR